MLEQLQEIKALLKQNIPVEQLLKHADHNTPDRIYSEIASGLVKMGYCVVHKTDLVLEVGEEKSKSDGEIQLSPMS